MKEKELKCNSQFLQIKPYGKGQNYNFVNSRIVETITKENTPICEVMYYKVAGLLSSY